MIERRSFIAGALAALFAPISALLARFKPSRDAERITIPESGTYQVEFTRDPRSRTWTWTGGGEGGADLKNWTPCNIPQSRDVVFPT